MLFNTTTDKLSLITAETCDVDVVVTFIDRVTSTGAVGAADRQLTHPTTATTTDILAVPASDTERKVEQITIRNAHATTSVDVTVQFNANGTLYELHAARLYPTEMLSWNEQTGFVHKAREARVASYKIHDDKQNDCSTTTVNGASDSDITVPALTSCVPVSTRSDRRFSMLSGCFTNSAIATTACRTSFFSGFFTLAVGIVTQFGNLTNAVTAAAMWGGTTTYVSVPVKGTDVLAGGVGLTMLAGGASFSGVVRSIQNWGLRYSSEVAASQANVAAGSWMTVHEDTEML